jgi:undecaprenyl-diphosphatase
MSTFQILIEGFLRALNHLIPVSDAFSRSLLEDALHWPAPSPELELLILLAGSAAFLVYFRFDWLALVSAFLRSLFNPVSLRPDRRTLDQHSLLFLALAGMPLIAVKGILLHSPEALEHLQHPFLLSSLTLVLAALFHFSYRWNKRIHGLNHLRLSHGAFLAGAAILSAHPALPWIGLLWIGFAFCNYHYEAIFKYSMLLAGAGVSAATVSALFSTSLRDAFHQTGYLNSIAVLVVAFSIFWIGLENLGKSLSEASYKSFLWINGLIGIYLFASHFITQD